MGSTFLNLVAVVVVVVAVARTCVCINIAGLNVMTFILRVGLQEVCVCGWSVDNRVWW